MAVVLSDVDTLRFLRMRTSYLGRSIRARRSTLASLERCCATARELEGEQLLDPRSDDVVGLLVPRWSRRPSKHVAPRVWSGPTPVGSFWHVRGNLYVCSPEFLAVLIVERMGLYQLVECLYELCGTYSVDPASGKLFSHEPLTSVSSILSFIEMMPGERGVAQVRRALTYVRDGSASPRETGLAMMLALPTRLGGFGLPAIRLNYRIEPPEIGETSFEALRGDIVLPPDEDRKLKGVAMEYESDEWHDECRGDGTTPFGRSRLANDSMRRRAYVAAGYFAITVTNDEIRDFDELYGIVCQVRRKRGMRKDRQTDSAESRRRALHAWLFAPVDERGDEPYTFRSRAK